MKHYKYIHVFWHDDLKFNPRIVEMINDEENGFNVEDHFFVTPFDHVFQAIKDYPNVMLYQTDDPNSADLINDIAPYGDWLFVNSLPDWLNTLKIKRKYQRKIIWRTWGHEFIFEYRQGEFFRNLEKKLVTYLLKREIGRFRAVGVSNIVDELDVKDRFGDVKTVLYNYPGRREIKNTAYYSTESTNINAPYRVMIGHSGHVVDNHIEILKMLEKFQGENVQFYLVFSYGNDEHMKKVREYVSDHWKDQITIIDEFMEYPEFAAFCSQMDAVILDGIQSYALGNVGIFIDLQKKFFLNRQGLLHRAFLIENIPHKCTDELSAMDFVAFTEKVDYTDADLSNFKIMNYDFYVNRWRMMLSEL